MTSETRFTRRCFRASKRGQRAQTRDCLLPQPGTTRVTLCRSSRVFLGVPLTLSLSARCKALPSLSLRSLQLRCRLLLLVTLVTGFLSTPFEQTPRGELLSRTGSLSRPGTPGLRSSTAPPIPPRDEAGVHGPTIDAGAFTVDAGEAAWAQLEELTGVAQPDAVLAANDLLALGIMRGARNAGRVVPDDLGVVGMDDIHFARISSPSLTSVSLGARVRGQLAAELLRERLERPARPPREELVRPSLVLRESTAHPRSGHKLPENTRG